MARAKAPSLLFVGSLPHDMLAGERECLFSRHLLLLLLLLLLLPLLRLFWHAHPTPASAWSNG